jgi:hypothetical protein
MRFINKLVIGFYNLILPGLKALKKLLLRAWAHIRTVFMPWLMRMIERFITLLKSLLLMLWVRIRPALHYLGRQVIKLPGAHRVRDWLLPLKPVFLRGVELLKTFRKELKPFLVRYYYLFKETFIRFMNMETYRGEDRQLNRNLALLIATLLILDYLMFCFHTDKNIFAIFPDVPKLSRQHEVTVYLPALDGASLLTEKRMAADFENDERFILFLFQRRCEGSIYQNTSMAIAAGMHVRRVWVMEKSPDRDGKDICAIDCEVPVLDQEIQAIPGSEPLFREALRKTVAANIPRISEVVVLERGIPYKKLW